MPEVVTYRSSAPVLVVVYATVEEVLTAVFSTTVLVALLEYYEYSYLRRYYLEVLASREYILHQW